MKKLNISKEQIKKIVAGLLAVAGLGYVYIQYWLNPTLDQMKKDRAEIAELERRLDELKRRTAGKDRLMAEIAQAQREWEDLKIRLPEDRQLTRILETIHRTAQKYRLELTDLTPMAPIPMDLYYEIPVELAGSCSYHDLAMFLTEMGSLERLYHARDVQIQPGAATAANPNATINTRLTLVTFQYKGG